MRATPLVVPPANQSMYYSYVKTPDAGAVNYNEQNVPLEMITSILFEEVGGAELINIARHDTIDGIDVDYSLVGNISEINAMFNSNNIISGFEARDTYLNQFPIDVWQRLDSISMNEEGDLVVNLNSVESGEEIEVQILTDGIIYTV